MTPVSTRCRWAFNSSSSFSLDWRLVAAGSVVSILPVLALFVLQRFILPSASGDARVSV